MICWGDDSYGESTPLPSVNGASGGASAISASTFFTLAIAAPYADTDADGVLDPHDGCPTVANADQADADGDLVGDACDNCTNAANPRVAASFLGANPWATLTGGQRDDDHDGYGNRCDADFTTIGRFVGSADLHQMRTSIGRNRTRDDCGTEANQPCARYDLNESASLIGSADLAVYRSLSGKLPPPTCPTCPLECTAGSAGTCF